MKMFITILFFIMQSSFGASAENLEIKFMKSGAQCNHENPKVSYCVFDKGHFNYPNKTTILFHKNASIFKSEKANVKNILFHLHGHSFGPLGNGEDFDSTPETMIHSFNFQNALASVESDAFASLAIVIPFTTGRCHDFDHYLAKDNNFENYILSIKDYITKKSPVKLHLSAHSGGGRTIAKTVNNMKTLISSVSLFDAIYNSADARQYISWVNLNHKVLNLVALAPTGISERFKDISGQTPFNESKRITLSLKWQLNFSKKISLATPDFYHHQKQSAVSLLNFFYQGKFRKHQHWYLLKDSFPKILETIMK